MMKIEGEKAVSAPICPRKISGLYRKGDEKKSVLASALKIYISPSLVQYTWRGIDIPTNELRFWQLVQLEIALHLAVLEKSQFGPKVTLGRC